MDDIVTVSEDEISEAMRRLARDPKTTAEASGAVSVAAFLFHRAQLPGSKFHVAIISGGNIAPETLDELKAGAHPSTV